jgi:hypothetical protein
MFELLKLKASQSRINIEEVEVSGCEGEEEDIEMHREIIYSKF